MSTSMRVVELVRFGDADTAFATRELPRPTPGPGQVLVRVEATSVNPLDLQTRRGDYRDQVALPAVIGNDVSGVVVGTGPGADDFRPGDEVWYLAPVFAGQGTYAEFHVVDQAVVARKPAGLSHVEAAGLALVGMTAWRGWSNAPDCGSGNGSWCTAARAGSARSPSSSPVRWEPRW